MGKAWYEYTNKKYVFTGETRDHHGYTLRRIKRTSDGLVGGWIESERNLSQDGDCFVYDDAIVMAYAKVFDNAVARDTAEVGGFVRVGGDARIYGSARIFGNALVLEDVRDDRMYGNAVGIME